MALAFILILCVWAVYYFTAQASVRRIQEDAIRVYDDDFTSRDEVGDAP
jgi:hypothetical protein